MEEKTSEMQTGLCMLSELSFEYVSSSMGQQWDLTGSSVVNRWAPPGSLGPSGMMWVGLQCRNVHLDELTWFSCSSGTLEIGFPFYLFIYYLLANTVFEYWFIFLSSFVIWHMSFNLAKPPLASIKMSVKKWMNLLFWQPEFLLGKGLCFTEKHLDKLWF